MGAIFLWRQVLIVEDDDIMREVMSCAFKDKGYKVLQAADGEEALEVFYDYKKDIDLIILDVMMPKVDGWSVCRRIRENSTVAIIMVTSRHDDSDKLLGYELGVDEYETKPINVKVLIAKSERLLERISSSSIGKADIVEKNGIHINKEAYTVKVDGVLIDLAPKEYELLLYLIENHGRVLSREKILDTIWGYDYFGDDRVVDTHIKKVRKKIGEKAQCIHTVVRAGYKFEF